MIQPVLAGNLPVDNLLFLETRRSLRDVADTVLVHWSHVTERWMPGRFLAALPKGKDKQSRCISNLEEIDAKA